MNKKAKKREIKQAILKQLSNNGHRSFRPKELAQKLGYQNSDTYRLFRATLQDLVQKDQIKRVKGNRFSHKGRPTDIKEGILRVSREGYGFVDVDGEEDDIFVPKTSIHTAFDGDRVRIRIKRPSGRHDRSSAEVLEILERGRSQLTGITKKRKGTYYVEPDDTRFNQQLFIHESETGDLEPGLKVVVSLGEFDGFRNAYRATVQEVLGPAEDPQVLMEALIRQFSLSKKFPKEVNKEVNDTTEAIPEAEYQRRLDLRKATIFTIDPADAKDFDDAIHIKELGKDRFEIGIHIADVSYFVHQKGKIDQEAIKRSTSVYLADRVIPMLPERLSNQLCSLRPGEDKLTFSCILEVDVHAQIHAFSFHESVIHSKHRFTYEEAQEIIEGNNSEHPLAPSVTLAAAVANAFTEKRFKEGSIEFDLPEIRVEVDEAGNPLRVYRKEIRAANRLIEEFMLLANQCAARVIEHPGKETPPFVYRVHDRPNEERIQQLVAYMRTFGLQLSLEDGTLSSVQFNALLERVKETPSEPIIKTAALRAMAKACYSTENIGHYGLGFTHYSHFTSPIRRYPDLIAHRLLKYYLLGNSIEEVDELEDLCEHSSRQERLAEEAERASTRQKQVLLAEKQLGESFEGVITNATRFGLFVELEGLWLEGLVHVRELLDDYYEYDKERYALVGSHTGKSFRAGDRVKVQLAKANPHTREIELVLLD